MSRFLPAPGHAAPAARIDGAALDGTPHELPHPASGDTLATVGWADAACADEAVEAASRALPGWRATSPRKRAAALRAIAASLREHAEDLAALVSAESGKRLVEARGEVEFSAHYFDWFADAATQLQPGGFVSDQRRFSTFREPVGVVAAVNPWNFPLSIPARKVAPALAAGCTVVQKASELTPLSSLVLTELAEEHLPTGALGVLVGDGAALTPALVDHPDTAAVSFTGSTRVGVSVAELAARSLTRTVLELGGKAPFIVTDRADPQVALEALLVAKFRNNGASCIAANNVFVHRSWYDEVVSALRERVPQLVNGDPADPATDLGPLLRAEHVARLEKLVDLAAADDCPVYRCTIEHLPGFHHPATLVELTGDTGLWHEEIFGPVLAVRPYDDEDAVVEEVNGWRYGLGGYVCSADTEQAHALAERLRIGIVGINNGAPNTPEVPFGGFGWSGLGREGGLSGLLEFTAERTVSQAR